MNVINSTSKPKKKFKLFSRLHKKMVNVYVQHPSLAKFDIIQSEVRVSILDESSKNFNVIFGKLPNGKEGYMIFNENKKLIKENISGRTSSIAKSYALEFDNAVIFEDAMCWIENKFNVGVNTINDEHT